MLYHFSRNTVNQLTISEVTDSHDTHKTSLYLFPCIEPAIFGIKPQENRPDLWNNLVNPMHLPEDVVFSLVYTPDVLTYLRHCFEYDADLTREENIEALIDMALKQSDKANLKGEGLMNLLNLIYNKGRFSGKEWADAFMSLHKTFPELRLDECPQRLKPRIFIEALTSGSTVDINEKYFIDGEGRKHLRARRLSNNKPTFHPSSKFKDQPVPRRRRSVQR